MAEIIQEDLVVPEPKEDQNIILLPVICFSNQLQQTDDQQIANDFEDNVYLYEHFFPEPQNETSGERSFPDKNIFSLIFSCDRFSRPPPGIV